MPSAASAMLWPRSPVRHPGSAVPVSEIAVWLRERVPADTDLDRPTMAELARRAGREQMRSGGRTSATTPRRASTSSSTATRTSTSGSSAGSTARAPATTTTTARRAPCACARARCYEDWFRVEEDGWVRERTTEHEAGGSFDFDAADIHGVRHPGERVRRRRPRSTSTRRRSGGWGTTSPALAGCAAWG